MITNLFESLLFIANQFSELSLISDDWVLLKAALSDPFPIFKDWTGELISRYHRPIPIFTFYINYLFFNENFLFFYLFNLIIHLINTIILYNILNRIICILQWGRQKLLLILLCVIFFAIPQNIMNVLWVSGRTDLLCALFSFWSILFLINYIEKKIFSHLFYYTLTTVLAFLCKETAVIILGLNFGIYLLWKQKINKKVLISSLIIFFVILTVSISINYSIGTDFSAINILRYLNYPVYLIKFVVYGLASFLIPFDFKDLAYFYNSNFILFIFLSSGCIYLIAYTFKLFFTKKKSERTIIFASIGFILLSLLIYINSYPQMRLFYIHSPLLIIIFMGLFHQEEFSKPITQIFFVLFFLLVVYGNLSTVNRLFSNNMLTKNLISVLPSAKEYNPGKKYLCLSMIERIGQSWGNPPVEIIASYKVNEKFNSLHNFISIATLDIINTNELRKPIRYKIEGDLIVIKSEAFNSGFSSLPSVRFSDSTSHSLISNILVYSKKEDILKNGLSKMIYIKLPGEINKNNTEIMFYSNGQYKRMLLKEFRLYKSNRSF